MVKTYLCHMAVKIFTSSAVANALVELHINIALDSL